MAIAIARAKPGRKPDELSILIIESVEYLEEISHPVTVAAVKEIVLDEIGTGPKIYWGPIDAQAAIKVYVARRTRMVLVRMGYVAVDGETYERVMYAHRTKQHVRECIRYLKQLRVYDENRIRLEEGILALMDVHRVRSQDLLPEDELEVLYSSIYA
jgi:hypothetical protein